MTSLKDVTDAWEQAQPKRAAGGRWALAGFHFQFNDSLLQFFQSVTGGQAPEHAAFDRLSDYATESDGLVFVAQHKRTLRKANYFDALGEFLAIENFLFEKFPTYRQHIKYRIVTGLVDGIDPHALPDLSNTSQADEWHKIVAEDRFLGVQERPNPWHELLQLLWPRVKRPVWLIDNCMRLLFEKVARGTDTAEELGKGLLTAYESERIDTPDLPCPLLSPEDMALTIGSGTVLMGKRPTPEDWRTGCFMPRAAYVDQVIKELDAILGLQEVTQPTQKVPLIWITGGSGVGKSGLLLASLERILRDRDIECAWVRGSPPELAKTLEKAPRHRLLVGIDDLYAPQWRSSSEWNQLISQVRDRINGLILIASAPTEYVNAFKQNSVLSELFNHHEIRVEPLGDEERADYAQWYAQRTGAAPNVITAARGDPNFVLASLRYQILTQQNLSLEEFVARLWERLRELAIEVPMAATLAGIRLGIRAPFELFGNASAHDALIKLNAEYLFLMRSKDLPDGSISRSVSTHRRLAEELYALGFPNAGPNVRAEHLLKLWRHADPTTRQALFDVVGKKDKQVEENLAHAFLQALGKELACDAPTAEDFQVLAAWQLCASQRQRNLPVSLQREALDWLCRQTIGGTITPELRGCAYELCWPLLVEPNITAARKLPTAAQGWLAEYPNAECWNQIWQRLWENPTERQALLQLARRWLETHRDHVGWTYVFQKLFDAGVRDLWLAEEAYAALLVLPPNTAEYYVLIKANTLIGAADRMAELWMARLVLRPHELFSARTTARLTELGDALSTRCIEQVTERHADAIGAGYVLQFLLGHFKSGRLSSNDWCRTSTVTLRWLSGREDRPEWSHVWRSLVAVLPVGDAERRKLLTTGLDWLSGREDRPEWVHVWQRLVEVLPAGDAERRKLLTTGLDWLSGREDKPEWNYIWQRLVEVLPVGDAERRKLLTTGLDWLGGREDRPDWSHVWRSLVAVLPAGDAERRKLLTTGLDWLSGREDKPEWNYIWQHLVEVLPTGDAERRKLLVTGLDWLSGREDRPNWSHVWEHLVNVLPSDDNRLKALLAAGMDWLSGRESKCDWPYVWTALIRQQVLARQLRRTLYNTGTRWLIDHPSHPGVPAVRATLVGIRV